MSAKKLLFIPVSSPEGIGEYMRSLQLAEALQKDFGKRLDIHFLLNKHTAYASRCPFSTTLLNQSPTKESQLVCQFIEQYKPDVVVFDCSGRAEQMKAAKKIGAKVVFISQHTKKRSKGLKLNRMGLIDTHWVVQPSYCIAPLSWLEKLKLKLLPLAYPTNVGALTVFASENQKNASLTRHNLKKHEFFIINAGSGGHKTLNGKNCADIYFQAGVTIAKQTGLKGIVVFGPNYDEVLPQSDVLVCLPSQKGSEFLALLSQAKFALLSGGDTLLQAITLHIPSIACAISKDQRERIICCLSTGGIEQAELDIADIAEKAQHLLTQPNYNNILNKYTTLENEHSYEVITQGLKGMLFKHR